MKGCEKCPAFAKCTVTYRGSACDALRHSYGLDEDPEIVTNADRIRAMSDEELCEFLMHDAVCDQNMTPDCVDCESCVLGWLRQPVQPTPDVPDTREHSGLLEE